LVCRTGGGVGLGRLPLSRVCGDGSIVDGVYGTELLESGTRRGGDSDEIVRGRIEEEEE
jgi:hypothetical protein